MKRGNGVLLHISSLPSDYGVGSMGRAAYRFIDRLRKAGQRYWQTLPCFAAEDNDPYMPVSAFAGDPFLIDIALLKEEGFLSEDDLSGIRQPQDRRKADYEAKKKHLHILLQKAYQNGAEKLKQEFTDFKYQNAYWLFDYAFYMAISAKFGGPPEKWEAGLAQREPAAMIRLAEDCEEEIACYQFEQFLFDRQMKRLKEYANQNGVKLIGELPFYLSGNCVERWASPELFLQEEATAGRPPQSGGGQGENWKYPLYDWNWHGQQGYHWWMERMRHSMRYCDILCVDRLREADAYYVIPKDGKPKDGCWQAGPGQAFCDTLKYWLGDVTLLSGDIDAPAPVSFNSVEYCGMMQSKVLHLAFAEADSEHLPHHYGRNDVCYTAGPRGNTTKGWFAMAGEKEKVNVRRYFGAVGQAGITEKILRTAMMSVAGICILPMQDVLELGGKESVLITEWPIGNWEWRVGPDDFDADVADALKVLTETYGR